MSETNAVDQFIFDALTAANTGMAICNTVVVDGVTYPVIVFQLMSPGNVRKVAEYKLYSNMLYLVKCMDISTNFSLADIGADKIDRALEGQIGITKPSGTILSCFQDSPYSKVETIGKTEYYSRGGIYRIRVKKF